MLICTNNSFIIFVANQSRRKSSPISPRIRRLTVIEETATPSNMKSSSDDEEIGDEQVDEKTKEHDDEEMNEKK